MGSETPRRPRRRQRAALAGALLALLLLPSLGLPGCEADTQDDLVRGLSGESLPSIECGDCPPAQWVRYPAGTFAMGAASPYSEEGPAHDVTVASFDLLSTEARVCDYCECVRAGACAAPRTGDECNWGRPDRWVHPVNCITWQQARDFAGWLDARLPTEAEWEYAARGAGRAQEFPWGDAAATCDRAVMTEDGNAGCGLARTWPVCAKAAAAPDQGLCDMGGNVWEWVEDCWHGSYDGAPSLGSAWTTGCDSADRVVKGGGWKHEARFVRAAARGWLSPAATDDAVGVRPARTVTPE